MAVPTVLTVKAATVPQITPIRTPRVLSPVHHSTPKPMNSVTTINTTMDNITVAAILESILHPIFCVASVMSPTLFAEGRLLG
jgi:hypothetical protein